MIDLLWSVELLNGFAPALPRDIAEQCDEKFRNLLFAVLLAIIRSEWSSVSVYDRGPWQVAYIHGTHRIGWYRMVFTKLVIRFGIWLITIR